MKKIGLVVKSDNRAMEKADEFEKWLIQKDIEVIRKEKVSYKNNFLKKKEFAPYDLFCIFVLGGDGTFLTAARWSGNQNIPIIGVKFGEVGFLAELSEKNLFSAAENIITENFITEPRMRLQVQVIRNNLEYFSDAVLNDIVINKGTLARLANIKTYIDDKYLTTYRADGLIISTPTGSTAYSLAAGGPIIHPSVPGILMTPICPFTLTNRPLLVPESVSIKIEIEKKSSDINLTIDGQEGIKINRGDEIIIKKWPYPVNMIKIPGQLYYDILKAKLRWSGSRV
ncbi:MAG: NAD(+)/NADH kinase [Desulfosarcina sp.]|nr:NAD(+)/NADH kinase [Desulfobacterales bacterium]